MGEFDEAIRLGPELFEAHYYYARACFAQGLYEKAVHLFERAAEIRPEDYQTPNHIAITCIGLERPDDAQASYQRCLDACEKHLELFPDDARALYFGAQSLVYLGDRERGLKWVERARAAEPEEPIVLYNAACVYANIDEHDKAIDCLDDAVTFGIAQTEWFHHDPDLNPLRENPRFIALLERLGTSKTG